MIKLQVRLLIVLAASVFALCSNFAPVAAQLSADGRTYTVNTAADSGDGSLRAAIEYANAHPGTTIRFAVPYVLLTNELPAITADATIIDALPQKLQLRKPAASYPSAVNGLYIQASNCIVRGLDINDFSNGIHIGGASARANRVESCYFGVSGGGGITAYNTNHILIDGGATNNIIGGVVAEAANTFGTETINSSTYGIVISGSGTNGNKVQGNSILRSAKYGVLIEAGAGANVIGGDVDGARNLVQFSRLGGITVTGTGTDNNIVRGNIIRGNGSRTFAGSVVQDSVGGIYISGGPQNTVIGGTTAQARNYIFDNTTIGIAVELSHGTTIQGNHIGANGTIMVGNGEGIVISSSLSTLIGGTQPGAGNLISGNQQNGIHINMYMYQLWSANVPNAQPNRIQGNRIGTDAAGTSAIRNNCGILIEYPFSTGPIPPVLNEIGGNTPAAGNLISGNGFGIRILGDRTVVRSNRIGTDASGTVALPNVKAIYIYGQNNYIGFSPTESSRTDGGNIIAFNHWSAIDITNLGYTTNAEIANNYVRYNSIWDNAKEQNVGLGIDLTNAGDSTNVTPNDALDGDTGPNDFQNFPIITSASIVNGKSIVSGTFNSKPNRTYVLDFYGSQSVHRSGYGEGQLYLGSTNVTTDANGDATFSIAVTPGNISRFVTATATYFPDSNSTEPGGTSEFSAAMELPPSVQFSAPEYSVSESGGSATITVTRSGSLTGAVSVGYWLANGSAMYGSDYLLTAGTLYFADGEGTKTFTITINNDTLDEADETIRLFLRAPGGNVVGGSPSQATLTIIDDDASPTLSVSDASVAEGAAGTTTTATFTVTLSEASGQQVIVRYNSSNGTAVQPADYTYSTGTFKFSPGQTSQTFTVPVQGDATIEADETFRVSLIGPINATVIRAVGIGTIVNDDFPTVSISDASATESASGSVANFTVTLSAPSPQLARVSYSTFNITATAPGDYTAVSGTIEFPPGQTTKTISVTISDDTTNEATETFRVNLLGATGATVVHGTGVGIGTILDNDPLPALSINDTFVIESDGGSTTNATFSVTLSSASGRQVVVRYYTSDGTARQPGDYSYTTGTLVFAPGETSKSVVVTVHNDDSVEDHEAFRVNLIGPINATLGRAQGIGTIGDDDGGSIIPFFGRVVPIVITQSTYAWGKQNRQPLTLTYAPLTDTSFDTNEFVLTDLSSYGGKSVAAMRNQIINGAANIQIGNEYRSLSGTSGPIESNFREALATVFQSSSATPWQDNWTGNVYTSDGIRYNEIVLGLSQADNPRTVRLVVTSNGLSNGGGGTFDIPVVDFAPVYLENVRDNGTTLTLQVRFSPPEN